MYNLKEDFCACFFSHLNIVHCCFVRYQLVCKKRSEGNNENFALAGRRLSAPLICVTIIGLAVGGASTIGVSEHAFRVGLSAGWYTIAWALGAIVMGLFMAKNIVNRTLQLSPSLLNAIIPRAR